VLAATAHWANNDAVVVGLYGSEEEDSGAEELCGLDLEGRVVHLAALSATAMAD